MLKKILCLALSLCLLCAASSMVFATDNTEDESALSTEEVEPEATAEPEPTATPTVNDAFQNEFLPYFDEILNLFKIDMNVYGLVFSFWDVFLFSIAASCIVAFIGGFLSD